MMAASKTALHLICLLLWREGKAFFAVHLSQLSVLEQQFIMADAGDNVTLPCVDHSSDTTTYYWYKQHFQRFGDKPEAILSRIWYNTKAVMSEKFKNCPRFSTASEAGINHLNISDVQMSDSAVYYCGLKIHDSDIHFQEGITLHVKGSSSSIQAIVQQPPEKKPGDSVTLNCTVHTAGTDYAVALCGEILSDRMLGGTSKITTDKAKIFLGVALVICIILVIVLSSIICKLNWGTCSHSGHSVGSSTPPTNTGNEDSLHYAAVSLSKRGPLRPLRDNMERETVYSAVRQ